MRPIPKYRDVRAAYRFALRRVIAAALSNEGKKEASVV